MRGLSKSQASSSIGRAAVSKTAGWGFDSLLACQIKSGILHKVLAHDRQGRKQSFPF